MNTKDVIAQAEKWFEANYLDGDKIQDGQILSSKECFDALTSYTKDLLQSVKGEIIKWCNQRCEANIRIHGTDKWNGDLEDLIAKLTEETDSIKS